MSKATTRGLTIDTTSALIMTFGGLVVPLSDVAAVYYPHLAKDKLNRRAKAQGFDFPVFRAADNQKAPWLVNLSHVAAHLDRVSATAQADFEAMGSVDTRLSA